MNEIKCCAVRNCAICCTALSSVLPFCTFKSYLFGTYEMRFVIFVSCVLTVRMCIYLFSYVRVLYLFCMTKKTISTDGNFEMRRQYENILIQISLCSFFNLFYRRKEICRQFLEKFNPKF